MPDGAKFCSNCGAVVGSGAPVNQTNNVPADQASTVPAGNSYAGPQDGMNGTYEMRQPYVDPMRAYVISPTSEPEPTGIDKFGKFFWIPLVILTIVDFVSDPAIVTILLSISIISGAVFALSRKYKLKGFHIICIILAVICLLCGISQAKKIGLFKVPGKNEYASMLDEDKDSQNVSEATGDASKETNSKPTGNSNSVSKPSESSSTASKPAGSSNALSKPSDESSADTNSEADETESSEPANEIATGGVDPDLKAFLDSYEDFVDEYVDFMKKYMADPTNVMGMLTEYTDMMTELADFETKLDAYDTNNMSTQDAAYYLEVTTRCTQKMLEIL